jgi:hypothetical protein
MEPDRRHPVKARALRAPGSAVLQALTDDAGPPGVGMQVRQTCLVARNHFYAATRWLEYLTSVPEFLAAFIRWTLTRERRHGKETEGALSGNDNRSPSAEPLDPRIRRIAEAIGRQLARAGQASGGR